MAIAPLSSNALHVVIDMQRMFAEDTAWHTPAISEILPSVIKLSETFRHNTLFLKFMLPESDDTAPGHWKAYYRRWSTMTLAAVDPAMQELIDPLKHLAKPDNQIEKSTYSAFGTPLFADYLEKRNIDTIVFSGVETDVCVYASVLDAIDRGFRVILPADAVASSDRGAHDAIMIHVAPRLSDQIDITTTQDICDAWTQFEKSAEHG